jgi:hypothetical protein
MSHEIDFMGEMVLQLALESSLSLVGRVYQEDKNLVEVLLALTEWWV